METQYENIVYIPDGVPFSIDPTTIQSQSMEFMVENISSNTSSQSRHRNGYGSIRNLPHPHQQGSTGDSPHPDSTVDLDVHDMELDRNSPVPDYTLSFNRRLMEFARNLPRPSPYSLEDHPRRSSNRRDLGR